MKLEKFNLRKEPINGFMPTLTAYIIDDASTSEKARKRPCVVVFPGGGYWFCSEREAEPIALQFLAAGIPSVVVDYCVAPANHYPSALEDASEAIKLVRKHADEWGIDRDKIAVIGFSAGGHLAASISTLWDEEPIKTPDGANKPNAAILCYPVISSDDTIWHKGSFDNLCNGDEALVKAMSLENRVSEKTPPCFIWHTFTDGAVPVENSLVFANALRKAGVSCEMHIFPEGPHGLSLANSDTASREVEVNPHVAKWVELALDWLEDLFEKRKFGN